MELKYQEYFPFSLRQTLRQPLHSTFRDRAGVLRPRPRGESLPALPPDDRRPLRGQNKNDDNKTNGNSLNQKCLLLRRRRGWVPSRPPVPRRTLVGGGARQPGGPREVRLLGHRRRRPLTLGGAKRATTGSEEYEYEDGTRWRGILNFLCLGLVLGLTFNEGDERDDQRRGNRFDPAPHFADEEASDQNSGYFHSRFITLSHPPRSFLVPSHVTCHFSPTFSRFQILSEIFKQHNDLLSLRSSLSRGCSFKSERRKSALYSCLVFCCVEVEFENVQQCTVRRSEH